MKPLSELIELIEARGKSAPDEAKIIWQVLWVLAQHVKTITPEPPTSPRIYDPLDQSKRVNAIIASTQIIIDRETARKRMALLNKLKAAPGQMNCALFERFFKFNKWLTFEQGCDEWPLANIPNNDQDLASLLNEVAQFERREADDCESAVRENITK